MSVDNGILDYLRYLRDTSKRIGVQHQLEKVFVNRTSRGRCFQLRPDTKPKLARWLKWVGEELEKDSGKGLFLGIGGVFGKGKVGGPLLFVEMSWDQQQRKWRYIPTTLSLNYDLIAKILDEGGEEEGEEEWLKWDPLPEIVEEGERLLASLSGLKGVERVALQILKKLSSLKEFREIQLRPMEELNLEREWQLLRSRRKQEREQSFYHRPYLSYFPTVIYFIAPTPDQVTAYSSLTQLVEEVEREGFKNRVIEKLLKGVFEGEGVQFQQEVWEEMDPYIDKYIPLPLSDVQLQGVRNSFGYPISYIQGPPGTGKSHTIAAIALAGIAAGKKVLIVSQKVPAVEVLREKLTPFLGNRDGIPPFVYYSLNIRQQLRHQIKEFLDRYPIERQLREEAEKSRRQVEEVESRLEQVQREIEEISRELKDNLELEAQFAAKNEELQRLKREFETLYYRLTPAPELLSPSLLAQFKELIGELEELKRRYRGETLPTLLFQLNLIHNVNHHFPDRGQTSEVWRRSLLQGEVPLLLRRLLNFEERLLELEELKSRLRGNSGKLKRSLEFLRQRERELQRELLQQKNKFRILEKLTHSPYRDSLNQFASLLFYRKGSKIADYQQKIDWEKVLEIFPVWISEIRNIGKILPLKPELFDLVVVDEASQVNLAEIVPVFYRGKQILVVGDHKQLSINSTGLNFQLSTRLDQLQWEKHRPNHLSYQQAQRLKLAVTKASILDFLIGDENRFGIPEVMLNEHYRSVPRLAHFTNRRFYEGKLRIMTETPEKVHLPAFQPVKVRRGKRSNRRLLQEAQVAVELFRQLATQRKWRVEGVEGELPELVPPNFSIGILGFTRNQVELLRDQFSLLDDRLRERFNLFIGTTEEFQGHERDVMIISLALDSSAKGSSSFYQDTRRFNVATSRGKYFTFLLYRGIPPNFHLIEDYLNHFGFSELGGINGETNLQLQWRFDPTRLESEFERRLAEFLRGYILSRKEERGVELQLFNQVQTCGQKRLDFVLYNPTNRKFVAVEADGRYHFKEDRRSYSEAHLERIEILKRAGWRIINTPYFRWYNRGWLAEGDPLLEEELKRLERELDAALF